MDNEHGASKNGFHPSYFQQLRKFFQAIWAKSIVEGKAKERFDEHGGRRAACRECGAPVVRFRSLTGADYNVAVADAALAKFFEKREDIDEFIHERLQRAEVIIKNLRNENESLRKKLENG